MIFLGVKWRSYRVEERLINLLSARHYQYYASTLIIISNSLTLKSNLFNVQRMNANSAKAVQLTLGLLDVVFEDSGISQRRLASRLGVALGLANAHLRACIERGLVVVSMTGKRRFRYTLTDLGQRERMQLARQHLLSSLAPFTAVRSSCDALFEHSQVRRIQRVAFAGGSHLAEVALLSALKYDVDVIGLVNMGARLEGVEHRFGGGDQFYGRPVWASLASFLSASNANRSSETQAHCDAVVITDLAHPLAAQQQCRAAGLFVLVPSVLRLVPCAPEAVDHCAAESDDGTAVTQGSEVRRPARTTYSSVNEGAATPLTSLPKAPGVVSG